MLKNKFLSRTVICSSLFKMNEIKLEAGFLIFYSMVNIEIFITELVFFLHYSFMQYCIPGNE